MPTRQNLQIGDPVLSNFARAFGKQDLVSLSGKGFGNTADFMFPQMPHTVSGLTGEYYTYDFNTTLQLSEDGRKEGNYNKIEWDVGSDTYRLEDKGFSNAYDDRVQEAALGGMNLSEDAAEILPERVLRAYANDAITIATTSGNYAASITNTTTAAGAAAYGGAWDTSSTDIIRQVAAIKQVIHKNCGVKPDRIAMGQDVWTNGVLTNDDILAGLQAQQKSGGLEDFDSVKAICRTYFGLDGAVDDTIYDSANPAATDSNAYLFGKNVVVFVSKAQVARVKAMRFGFTAVKPREFLRAYKWFEQPHTNWRAVSFQRSIKLVADEAGYLLTSVVT